MKYLSLFLISITSFAHVFNQELINAPTENIIFYYIKIGFEHILPLGLDHILFILGISLLANFRSLLIQVSLFTLAHSITLYLSLVFSKTLVPSIVEPLIALSLVFVGIENLFFKEAKWHRYILVFLFGLLHGMGFAGILSEIGLVEQALFTSLISFNVGVEIGQLTIVGLYWFFVYKNFAKRSWYNKMLVLPASLCIVLIGLYWTFERLN